MTQVLEAGLAEVLREHEDKIAAAQAWCKQQNIRSLEELKSQGETAADEFVKAAGAIKVLDGFIIKRRVGAYEPPPPPPPSVPPQPAPYEDNNRSLLDDDHDDTHAAHAARCLRLRQTLPRLEMPCVRAATATVGVLLGRAGVTEVAIRRLIYAMAFAVPTDEERRAEAARDAKFVEDYGGTKNIATAAPMGANPPMRDEALAAAVAEALAGPPGMTAVAANAHLVSLADAPEAYDLIIFSDEGYTSVDFNTLLPFEAAFPAIVGCETLTIRSTFPRHTKICVGGRVRHIREAGDTYESDERFFTGELALPPIEHTFTAPRRSSSGRGYFAIADLARGLNVLPEEWRQLSRVRGLVAWDASDDGNLSFGRFKSPNAYGDISFGTCTLMVEWDNIAFELVDGDRGVLDLAWSLACDGMGNVESSQPPLNHFCFYDGANLNEMIVEQPRAMVRGTENENYRILKWWCQDAWYDGSFDGDRRTWRHMAADYLPLHRLRRTAIDLLRWNPGVDRGEFYPYLDDEDDKPAPAPAVADPEEDAELICRPRTTGRNA